MKTLGLFTCCTLAIFPWGLDVFLMPKEVLFLCGTIGLTLLFWLGGQSFRDPGPRLQWAVGLFLSGAVVSTLQSPVPQSSAFQSLLWVAALLFFLISQAEKTSSTDKDRFSQVVHALAVIQILLGILQVANAYFQSGKISKLYFAGTLGNPEYLAFFLGNALLLRLAQERKLSSSLLFLLFGVLMTASKISWILIPAVLFFHRKHFTFKSPRSLYVLPFFAAALIFRFGYRSFEGRILLWLVAAKSSLRSLFLGTGFSTFEYSLIPELSELFENKTLNAWFSDNAGATLWPHNEFLGFLSEGGLLCFLGFSLIVFEVLRRRSQSPSSLQPALLFSILFFLFSFPLHVIPNLLLFLLILSRAWQRDHVPEKRFRPLQPILWSTLLGLVVSLSTFRILSDIELKKAKDNLLIDARTSLLHSTNASQWALDDGPAREMMLRAFLKLKSPAAGLLATDSLIPHRRTVDLLKLRGLALRQNHRLEDALETYTTLSASYPAQITPHWEIGRISWEMGQSHIAKVHLETAIRLKSLSQKSAMEQTQAKILLKQLSTTDGNAR